MAAQPPTAKLRGSDGSTSDSPLQTGELLASLNVRENIAPSVAAERSGGGAGVGAGWMKLIAAFGLRGEDTCPRI